MSSSLLSRATNITTVDPGLAGCQASLAETQHFNWSLVGAQLAGPARGVQWSRPGTVQLMTAYLAMPPCWIVGPSHWLGLFDDQDGAGVGMMPLTTKPQAGLSWMEERRSTILPGCRDSWRDRKTILSAPSSVRVSHSPGARAAE